MPSCIFLVGSYTILYKRYIKKGDFLILQGQVIDTWRIIPKGDTLILEYTLRPSLKGSNSVACYRIKRRSNKSDIKYLEGESLAYYNLQRTYV